MIHHAAGTYYMSCDAHHCSIRIVHHPDPFGNGYFLTKIALKKYALEIKWIEQNDRNYCQRCSTKPDRWETREQKLEIALGDAHRALAALLQNFWIETQDDSGKFEMALRSLDANSKLLGTVVMDDVHKKMLDLIINGEHK